MTINQGFENGKERKRTSGVKHATIPMKPLKGNIRRTQVQPAIQNQKEHHSTVNHVEVQTNNISSRDKEVETEAHCS